VLRVSDKDHARTWRPSSALRSGWKLFSTHFTEVSAGTADAAYCRKAQSAVTAPYICWYRYNETGTRVSSTLCSVLHCPEQEFPTALFEIY
jgi:hypothetical protein